LNRRKELTGVTIVQRLDRDVSVRARSHGATASPHRRAEWAGGVMTTSGAANWASAGRGDPREAAQALMRRAEREEGSFRTRSRTVALLRSSASVLISSSIIPRELFIA
jgi:glycine/D-amino acid oxidase-like deaminating enzyme